MTISRCAASRFRSARGAADSRATRRRAALARRCRRREMPCFAARYCVRRVQAVEPVERALDLAIVEAGAAELALELVSVRLRLIWRIDVRLEQVHEYVEDGFFHQFFLPRANIDRRAAPRLTLRAPAAGAWRKAPPSSNRRACSSRAIGVGEKPSAFNNFRNSDRSSTGAPSRSATASGASSILRRRAEARARPRCRPASSTSFAP